MHSEYDSDGCELIKRAWCWKRRISTARTFFYTDTESKAKELLGTLQSLDYDVDYGQSAGDGTFQVVTGWTVPIEMSTESVVD